MSSRQCEACGAPLEDGACFCVSCGRRLAAVPAPEETPAVRKEGLPDMVSAAVPAGLGAEEPGPRHSPMAAEGIRPPEFRKEELSGGSGGSKGGKRRVRLEIDRLCVLFTGWRGEIRMRLVPAGSIENVEMELENTLNSGECYRKTYETLEGEWEVRWPIGIRNEAGAETWTVRLSYDADGIRESWKGPVTVLVIQPNESRKMAETLHIAIHTTVTTGHAADVHVNQRAADELGKLANAANPFEELRKMVNGRERSWVEVCLLEMTGRTRQLGAMPPAAAVEWLTLEMGLRKIFVYGTEPIRIGRAKEGNSFTLRVPPDQEQAWRRALGQMSRKHCLIEPCGDCIRVMDGHWDEYGRRHRSSEGTFWNGEEVGEEGVLVEAGQSGKLALGRRLPPPNPLASLRMQAIRCDGEDCRQCTQARGLRRWCRDGRRSSVLLERTDGLQEWFVGLWGCVDLGAVDREYDGLVLFRQAGGFAWRCGKECGWLVPGQDAGTPLGTIRVRQKANWEYLANGGGNR